MLSQRLVVIACQCQMMIGSYDGAVNVCSCKKRKECQLTLDQRVELRKHPQVGAALKRHAKEFKELQNEV
jgi:hypothetical protein